MDTNSQWKNEWHFVAAALPPTNRFATARIRRSVSKRQRKRFRNRRNNFCHSERSRGISRMKIRVALVLAFSLLTAALRAEKISLIGATVINPADGKVLPNATVVINGDKIERVAMGKQNAATLGKQIGCVGKFILPSYIDTHVHFFQSADLFTRPDGADFNGVRLYKDEVAWIKSHLDDVFARYSRSGITSVVDVGGPMWNFEVRKKANATAKAPRV